MKFLTLNMAKSLPKNRQRGFGLLDVILASVLLLGALAGIIILFTNANLSSNVSETGRVASTMSGEIRGLYRTSSDFAGLDTDQVYDTGIASSNLRVLVDTTKTIRTPFGGESKFEFAGDGNTFTMTVFNIPTQACERLAPTSGANEVGPLGTSYSVTKDCSATGTDAQITAVYSR
jgi:hypothetical protein